MNLFIDLWSWADHWSMQAWILQLCILNTALLVLLFAYTFGMRLHRVKKVTEIREGIQETEEYVEEQYDFPGATNKTLKKKDEKKKKKKKKEEKKDDSKKA